MNSKEMLDIVALCMTLIGSTILVIGFIPQSRKIYTLKHTYGISKVSWIQNYVGRLTYSLYCAFALGTATGDGAAIANAATFPTIIGQLLVGVMSVAVIYYTLRNQRTSGEYKKEEFRRKLFALRIGLDVLLAIASILIILMTKAVDVIHIPHGETHSALIFNIVFGIIAPAIVSTAFIPQSIKTIRTRNTKSTSLALTIMFSIGNSLLALMFVVKAINMGLNGTHDVALNILQYSGSIFFIFMGVFAMIIIIVIKVNNMKKLGEK